ncbi:2,5-diketo-D-gluconic acid reductase [Lysobacteraceae bacterium NML08-0793]|nr:2,5-diketo-D-gluconic acid reductase [Xanthomonadaceae bacterium NML08-0793]
MKTLSFSNGIAIPSLGFGTFQIAPADSENAVKNAIAAGYRHIDTAQAYVNETEVGAGIRASGVARNEIFLTSKVWVENAGYEAAKASLERSLKRLNIGHIDLMLIHQPYGDVYGTWRALEDAQAAGDIRAIGVSNFTADRAVDLGVFNRVMPQVNQIEINPFHQRTELVETLQQENIIMEAWAPFAEGKNGIFHNAVLQKIADKHGKSIAQVIIRWLLERNIVVLAKSEKPELMAQNLDVFDFALDDADKAAIATLDSGESQFVNHASVERVKWAKTSVFNI